MLLMNADVAYGRRQSRTQSATGEMLWSLMRRALLARLFEAAVNKSRAVPLCVPDCVVRARDAQVLNNRNRVCCRHWRHWLTH